MPQSSRIHCCSTSSARRWRRTRRSRRAPPSTRLARVSSPTSSTSPSGSGSSPRTTRTSGASSKVPSSSPRPRLLQGLRILHREGSLQLQEVPRRLLHAQGHQTRNHVPERGTAHPTQDIIAAYVTFLQKCPSPVFEQEPEHVNIDHPDLVEELQKQLEENLTIKTKEEEKPVEEVEAAQPQPVSEAEVVNQSPNFWVVHLEYNVEDLMIDL